MAAKAIVWKDAHYGSHNGYVDGLLLFTVHYHGGMMPKAEAEKDEKRYRLTSHLPGGKMFRCVSIEAGKAYADKLVEQFLTRLAA